MTPRVAVIGAGPLGLLALKNLKADGFEVTGFEARPFIGGIWKYSEDDRLSVAETTIFNSSKYRSAITDFPFPEETDDYPTWRQMNSYLESYCDHFDLRRHICLNSPVTNLTREGDQWALDIAPADSTVRRELFDKVVVAIGSFITPKIPKFAGIEKFEGPALHAINFKNPAQYKGKNILLIGLHATTQDVAVGLSKHASKLYISHRSGVLMLPRYNPDGSVFDSTQNLSLLTTQLSMMKWAPKLWDWLLDRLVTSISAKTFEVPKSWGLSPAPTMAITPPLIADEIYPLLASGFAETVPTVQSITGPRTVVLTDGRTLSDIDAIVYCTGYDLCTPFVAKEFNPYPTVGSSAYLYQGIFPLHEDAAVRNSLAFLGHGAVPFPGFAQWEWIMMAVGQIWQGHVELPPLAEMKASYQRWMDWKTKLLSKQKGENSSHFIGMQNPPEYMEWLHGVAGTGVFEHFGWFKAKAWAFWWNDRELYKACSGGLLSPSIWRLFETGKRKAWSGAREQIIEDNEVFKRGVKRRFELMKQAEATKSGKVLS